MSKREWGSWGFWITVATLAVAGGLGLPSLGHPVAGRRLFYFGLILGALLALGALGEWAGRGLVAVSNPVLQAIQRAGLFVAEALAWLGALLVGPAIRRILREKGLSETSHICWTASQKRGKEGSDFLPIARDGFRVSGARFVVRADNSSATWHAGFRLTPRNENLEDSSVKRTILIDVSPTYLGAQDGHAVHREGQTWGPYVLPRYSNPLPGYLFDFSVSHHADPALLWVTYRINDEQPQRIEFLREYADQLVLVAWADRSADNFLVHFELLSTSWTPMQPPKK
jgi:hypothetical protein